MSLDPFALTPAERQALRRQLDMADEIARTEKAAAAEVALIRGAAERAANRQPGDEWRAPDHVIEAYAEGEIVAVGARTFRSLHDHNSRPPLDPALGSHSWVEVWSTADGWTDTNPTTAEESL